MACLEQNMLQTIKEHTLSDKNFVDPPGGIVINLPVETTNLLSIRRKALPIVFLPGIMGSRLKNGGNLIWDLDSGFLAAGYGAYNRLADLSAGERYALLAAKRQSHTIPGNPGDSLTDEDKEHNLRFSERYPHGAKRGWGGVYWQGYGDLLKALDEWNTPLKLFLDMPVYAVGYNWMLSSKDSGEKVAVIIKKIKALHNASHVLLITHSMGGLVARWACKNEGLEDIVYGVVHGAQPSRGAPDAYRRMVAGHTNEGLTGNMLSRTLGPDDATVTAVLAYSGGGLELLPSARYTLGAVPERFGATKTAWLHCLTRYDDGGQRYMSLPPAKTSAGNDSADPSPQASGDPYEGIYKKQGAFWNLLHPEWLDRKTPDSIHDVIDSLDNAKEFHDKLVCKDKNKSLYVHPRTIQMYSSGGNTTFCEIVWEAIEITNDIIDDLARIDSSRSPGFDSDYSDFSGNVYRRMKNYGKYQAIVRVPEGKEIDSGLIVEGDLYKDDFGSDGKIRRWIAEGQRFFRCRLLDRRESLTIRQKRESLTLPRIFLGDGTVPRESGRGLRPKLDKLPEGFKPYAHRDLADVEDDADKELHCTFLPTVAEHSNFFDQRAILAAKNALHNLALGWLEEQGGVSGQELECGLRCLQKEPISVTMDF
ncbi:MAG: hypothetical protein LBQ63_04950 [Deltaproteobacteria bacterium]|jgi:hypothetical protein|nr:hypothetical protein [Deltaproteobacteria bacterium]